MDQYTSVNREPGKIDATVRNSDIAKFGTRDKSKTSCITKSTGDVPVFSRKEQKPKSQALLKKSRASGSETER